MPICNSCHKSFPDFKELAKHIMANKKGHRYGQVWAARCLTNQRNLDRKVSLQNRGNNPLTQQEKENKQDSHRELSGQTSIAETICPKCKCKGVYSFPIEYIKCPVIWREGNRLVKLCISCGDRG